MIQETKNTPAALKLKTFFQFARYPELPSLSEIVSDELNHYWVTQEGQVGITFVGQVQDIEEKDLVSIHHKIAVILKDLDSRVLLRVNSKSVHRNGVPQGFSRTNAILEKGFVEHQIEIALELKGSKEKSFWETFTGQTKSQVELLKKLIPFETLRTFGLIERSFTAEEIQSYFSFEKMKIHVGSNLLYKNGEVLSIVRLWEPKEGTYPLQVLAQLRAVMPLGCEIVATAQRVDKEWALVLINRKKRSLSGVKDLFRSGNKQDIEAFEEDLKRDLTSLYRLEYQIIVRRPNEKECRETVLKVMDQVKHLGSVLPESDGCAPSFIATLNGKTPHYTYFERSETVAALLPIYSYGENHALKSLDPSSLLVHRLDGSLHGFNLFNPKYNSYCAAFIGKPGLGKSVTAQLELGALLRDENTRVTIIDVGGSWSKTVEELGGYEKSIQLTRPCSLSPFRFLSKNFTLDRKESALMIAAFLGRLMAERDEKDLPIEVKAQIEKTLLSWLETDPVELSFESYLASSSDIPRRASLERWAKGQIFENVLAGNQPYDRTQRLQYINFEDIFQTGDSDLALGGFAAIITQILIECQLAKKEGKRFVLVCDENPFFIQTAGFFFGFAVKNIRKLGQSIILIAQNSEDLVLTQSAKPMEVLSNLNTLFLFSVDGKSADYQSRLKLSDEEVLRIQNLRSVPKRYSEVLLKEGDGESASSRVLRIVLSTEENWTTTSNPVDRKRMRTLQEAFPELTRKEVIQCLAYIDRKRVS